MDSHTLFISDLHLEENAPTITATFLHFLQHMAPHADALYILGDFFETWIGDDDHSMFHDHITTSLCQLARTGMPIYFIAGNRDFLISHAFAKRAGIALLRDETVIDLYGQPVLLMHGDSLCTLDLKHQAYRKKVLTPWVQKLFLMMPLRWRRKIAQQLRNKSKHHHLVMPHDITDVTLEAVVRVMEAHHVSLLVHGHTHRPAIHEITLNNGLGQRIVLGAWHQAGSVLVYRRD